MITEKYKEYGDNLKTPNVVNPELYVSDELMIDLYIFGYIQRLLIPFVSHWIDTFKDKRDKVDSDDPLNVVLTRIWTYVLDLTFSKTRKERIENKIQKEDNSGSYIKRNEKPTVLQIMEQTRFRQEQHDVNGLRRTLCLRHYLRLSYHRTKDLKVLDSLTELLITELTWFSEIELKKVNLSKSS